MAGDLKRDIWGMSHLVAALTLTSLAVLAVREAVSDVYGIAVRDEESSHIFLVPIVFVWLVWVRRGRIRQCRRIGQWVGPLLVALGWVAVIIGYTRAVQSLWHGGSLVLVLGAGIAVVGTDVVRRFLPALFVLLFLIPVPGMLRQQVAIPLQETTAQVTHTLFEIFNIPIALSGSVLSINGVKIGIAEACNGLRMVFALVLVSYAFAFGTPLKWYVRLIVVVLSPVSAILCNVIRLIPTVWLYGYQGDKVGDFFHEYSGWFMLIIAFLILMGIIRLMRWALVPVTNYTLAYD